MLSRHTVGVSAPVRAYLESVAATGFRVATGLSARRRPVWRVRRASSGSRSWPSVRPTSTRSEKYRSGRRTSARGHPPSRSVGGSGSLMMSVAAATPSPPTRILRRSLASATWDRALLLSDQGVRRTTKRQLVTRRVRTKEILEVTTGHGQTIPFAHNSPEPLQASPRRRSGTALLLTRGLSQGASDYLSSRLPEVDRVRDVLRGDRLVKSPHHQPDGVESDGLHLGRAEALGLLGGACDIEVVANRSQLQLQDLRTCRLVGGLQFDYLVESPPDGRVQQPRVVRGGDEERSPR